MPSSSDSRTSDSSTISSRQVKQAKGKRSTGSAQTSPTAVLGSSAGPPHSLCISVSMSASDRPFNNEPVKMVHVFRAAQAMVPGYEVQLHRIGRIPTQKQFYDFTAAFASN